MTFASFCIQEGHLGLGYTFRKDKLTWSIAGENNNPNILSELTWKKLYINQISFITSFKTKNNFYVRAYADYGRIFKGMNQDSDYLESDRKEEFSRSISKADKGEVFDLSAAIGYDFRLCNFSLIPLIGASWEEQHLRLFHGKQEIPDQYKIKNLHSSYKTRWYGPWIGLDSSFALSSYLDVIASFEYHFNQYRGKGHWNLRSDFLSDFKHFSCGWGYINRVGINFHCELNWTFSFIVSFKKFSTDRGIHTLKIDDEEEGPIKVKNKLNSVKWCSQDFSFILIKNF